MPEYLVNFVSTINNLPVVLRLLIITFASVIEYVFPIFPGDTVVLVAGFLSAQGGLGLFELYLAVVIGNLIGCLITYAFGQAIADGRISRRWLNKMASPDALASWRVWYHRWGYFLILANRFFVGIRSFFFVAAGLYHLPLGKVLICGAVSALIFNSCIFALGYFLGNNVELIISILDGYAQLGYIILGVVILIFIGLKGWQWYDRRRALGKSKTRDSYGSDSKHKGPST